MASFDRETQADIREGFGIPSGYEDIVEKIRDELRTAQTLKKEEEEEEERRYNAKMDHYA